MREAARLYLDDKLIGEKPAPRAKQFNANFKDSLHHLLVRNVELSSRRWRFRSTVCARLCRPLLLGLAHPTFQTMFQTALMVAEGL
jgi:hypothetical protein